MIPGSGKSPGGGNGNPLQYPCLGNPLDRGAWRATVHGVAKIGQDLATKQQQHGEFRSPVDKCGSPLLKTSDL